MDKTETHLKFTSPRMNTLVFENPKGAYPVNRYQSLVLANSAYVEAIEVSMRASKPLCELAAIEICCGGGPAAIVLKDSGLGYVGASDIQACSVEQVRNNASLNGLSLDSTRIGPGLTPWLNREPWIDIIACNPPCLPGALVDERLAQSLRTAMQGGVGGTTLLFEIIGSLDCVLTSRGRFVFVVTSMMNFRSVETFLNTHFSRRWRVSPGTPVASPYCRSNAPIVTRLLKMREEGEAFVWLGNDGWLWRLTWSVALLGSVDDTGCDQSSLGLYPFGSVPVAEDYLHALEIFDCPLPCNPMPQMACP